MPRKPAAKNLNNPLRILRVLCSEHGEAAPLTQVNMARITGIAPDYVRSLENSRRPLNKSQLDKIRYSIGAVWDRKQKGWTVNSLPDEPFTYEWFVRYRTLWFNIPLTMDLETHVLCRRLQALLLGVEPEDYNLVFDRIYHALEEIRAELKVGAAKRVFDKTGFEIEHTRDEKTGEIESIQRVFPRMDAEIVRRDPERDILDGYLDLTPYSSSITHHLRGNWAPVEIINFKEGLAIPDPSAVERRNELVEKLKAEMGNG